MSPNPNSIGSRPPEKARRRFSPPDLDTLRDPLQTGITIVGTTAVFGGGGWWLDSLLGTFPILMVIGSALGLFGVIYLTLIRLREAERLRELAKRDNESCGSED